MGYTFLPLTARVCLHSIVSDGHRKMHVLCSGVRNGCSRLSKVLDFAVEPKTRIRLPISDQ